MKLPNGNPGIRLASGDLVDPVYLSVSNLARLAPDDFARVLAWVEGVREARAAQAEQREEELRLRMERERPRMEHRHQQMAAWAKRNM